MITKRGRGSVLGTWAVLVCLVMPFMPYARAANAAETLDGAIENALRNVSCDQLSITQSEQTELRNAYSAREFRSIWTKDGKANKPAQVLLAELNRSKIHGLKPEFYAYSVIYDLSTATSHEQLACFDILLSKAFVLYANDIANGHVRRDTLPSNTLVEPVTFGPTHLFSKATDLGNLQAFLKSLLTTDDRYVRLITKLAEFLRIKALNAWPSVSNLGTAEKPAVPSETLRELLLYTGDLSNADYAKATTNEDVIEAAVSSFQGRHGLAVTGQVDGKTFAEMALPLSQRIDMIRVNLERRRWQNRDLGPDYVYINTNDNSARFVKEGKKSGSARLLPSEKLEKLPAFYGQANAIKLDENGALAFEIISSGGDVSIELSLAGPVVENMAFFMNDVDAKHAALKASGRLELEKSLNLYVTYLTVWATKDGAIHFRSDRSDRDAKIAEILNLK